MRRKPWNKPKQPTMPITDRFAFEVPVTEEDLRQMHPDCIIVGFIVRLPDGRLELVADDGQ